MSGSPSNPTKFDFKESGCQETVSKKKPSEIFSFLKEPDNQNKIKRNLLNLGLVSSEESDNSKNEIDRIEHILDRGATDALAKGDTGTIQERDAVSMEDKTQKAYEAFLALSREQQKELLKKFNDLASRTEERSYAPPPLPEPGSGYRTIKPYVRMTKAELKTFVGEVWGQWLKTFTPELDRDYMCQADLRKRDERLLWRLEKAFTSDDLREIIPIYSILLDQKHPNLTKDEIDKANEISNMAKGRGLISSTV